MQEIKKETKLKVVKFILLQTFLLLLLLFLIFSIAYNAQYIKSLDTFIFNIISPLRNKFVNNLFLFITYLGETSIIISLMAVSIIILKKKSMPVIFMTTLSSLINLILKNIINRARPVGQFVNNLIINYSFPTDSSFPSGHSQTGLVFYFTFVYVLIETFYKGKHKNLFKYLSLLLPIFIMISRLIIGVHYFTDVIGGVLIALILINSYIFINNLHSSK